jgi:hypothetical protein
MLNAETKTRRGPANSSALSIWHWTLNIRRYQPQQSVLNPQDGQRQTACMRNISAPQRSQRTLSAVLDGLGRSGGGGGGAGWVGSGIGKIISPALKRLAGLQTEGQLRIDSQQMSADGQFFANVYTLSLK